MLYLVQPTHDLPAVIEAPTFEAACEIAATERAMTGPFTEGSTTLPEETIAACCAAVLALGEVIVPPAAMRFAVEADPAAYESLLCQPPKDGALVPSEAPVILDAFAEQVLGIPGWPDELSDPEYLIDGIAAALDAGKITRA